MNAKDEKEAIEKLKNRFDDAILIKVMQKEKRFDRGNKKLFDISFNSNKAKKWR